MNDRFIPLRVEYEENGKLAGQLGLERFPVFIYASPNGKIIGHHEGYLDAEKLQEQLMQALTGRSFR